MGNKVKMETPVCLGLEKVAPWALGVFWLQTHSSAPALADFLSPPLPPL